MVTLGGWVFLMSEEPLYSRVDMLGMRDKFFKFRLKQKSHEIETK